MKSFIVGKKYPMRNGGLGEYLRQEQMSLIFKHCVDKTEYFHELDGKFCCYKDMHERDIISDTPIEDDYDLNENGNFKNTEKNREYLRKRTDLIVSENGTISQRLVAAPKRPRQFDVSKLSRPILLPEDVYYSDPSHAQQQGEYWGEFKNKQEVLEAWNLGTLEELLTTWVESPKGE